MNCADNLSKYLEDAKANLARSIEQYKTIYGKSMVDQKLLVPQEYQSLIWFLFPSEALEVLSQFKF